MPYYTFRKKGTDKEWTLSMSMSDRETYLEANPDIEQLITNMNLVDPMRAGITKPPADFDKYVLSRVADSIPQNTVRQNMKRDLAREV